MRVLVETVERGSFAAAGEALEISARMAGRYVRALEDDIGARLIDRTTRRQRLTEAGELYYGRAKALLVEVADADASIHALSATPRGLLRATAPVTFGSSCMIPLVARFMQRYPQVSVDLTLSDRNLDLVENGFDAAIRIGELSDSSLLARPLAPYEFAVCASPAYVHDHGAPRSPEGLSEHQCLGFTYATRPTVTEWIFSRAGTEHRVRVTPRFAVNDARAMHAAAAAGLGIVLGPRNALEPDLGSGRLVALLTDYQIPTRPMHIVYKTRHILPKLSCFIDAVLAAFS